MKRILATTAFSLVALSATWAQRTPLHPLDIKDVNKSLHTIIEAWEPGVAPEGVSTMDDQFYISRVRPLERINEGDYQIHQDVNRGRKMCLWVPLDDPSTAWKGLPRYNLESDNFSLWSYIDIHGNWTGPWMRVTAGLSDVAHKNGVKVGCVASIPWAARISAYAYDDHSKNFQMMTERDFDDNFVNKRKIVELMKYYGIDALGCNSEFYSNSSFMSEIIDFFAECHTEAKSIDWDFQLHWYDGTNESGGITFDRGLGSHNQNMFGASNKVVTDMMFANYNWTGSILSNSVAKANQMGRNSYDYYAGFDIQGRSLKNNYWQALKDNPISIGFWGAHAQSLIHQSATDNGGSDLAIQEAYLEKQELMYSGGYRNPGLLPSIRTNCGLSNADLKTFHGLAAFLTAKSTIQQLPFVTRFSLGNGLTYKVDGKDVFPNKWYNLGMQDFMPTWRFWITDRNDVVTTDNINGLVKANLTFEDAWYAGSSLKLHGATDFSRVKLFKTKLVVNGNNPISITYKVLNGTDAKAKLFVSKLGALTEYKEIALPATDAMGEWKTFTTTAAALGLNNGDEIAMIGLTVENAPADYAMLIGELAVLDQTQTFNPVKPVIKEVEVLRGRHNAADFKIRYASKEEAGSVKTYNDEVDTWFFEIFIQQKGQEARLVTATPSWAAYVIGAPIVSGFENREVRYGVRAVAPDGTVTSDIAWTDYQALAYDDPIETVLVDKPVIKANEQFVIRMEDTMQEPAQKWELKNSLTGVSAAVVENSTSAQFQLPEEGQYDLYLTNSKGNLAITRGFIQITPEATGAVPVLGGIALDKTEASVNENINATLTINRLGEGKVSRGLVIKDPDMFKVSEQIGSTDNYTFAFWFKPDKWSHDKFGTNLINKRDFTGGWPHNNWGTFWVHVWPKSAYNTLNDDVISFTQHTETNPGFGGNPHESPNQNCMDNDFTVPVNVWTHVAISIGGGKQELWLNGKKVASQTRAFGGDNTKNNCGQNPIYVYIGGPNVYHSGFTGTIDDVQAWNKVLTPSEMEDAMKGYYNRSVPSNLIGYWDFEELMADGDGVQSSFANKGTGGNLIGSVVQIVGSGGENTAGAVLENQEADNTVLGNPSLTGTLDIITKAKWDANGANVTETANGAQLQFPHNGEYNVNVTLENKWGTHTVATPMILITGGTGVEDNRVEDITTYPNPFVDGVYMKFVQEGNYTVEIYSLDGRIIESQALDATSNEVVYISLNAEPGTYVMRITEANKCIKTIKLFKK